MERFLGRREFFSDKGIAHYITNSRNFNKKVEDPDSAQTLLFFSTSKQHTWLVATKHRLYCLLDDVRKPEPHINWSISRDKIFKGDTLKLEIGMKERSQSIGKLDFGEKHRNWLYSKSLFRISPANESVEDFLMRSMK